MEQLKVIQDLASQLRNAVFSNTNELGPTLIIHEEPTSGQDHPEDSNLVQSLREENERLRQEIAKKDAIIMEQLKVIQDLASQLRNAVFDTRYPLTMLT